MFDNLSHSTTYDLFDLEFFHAFVLKKIMLDKELIVTPHIHSLKLRSKGRLELFMVPIKAGVLGVYCPIPGHREQGMEGVFTFEQ